MHHDPAELIAIVGMAGRFPEAPDTDRFWDLLMDRGDAIRPVPAARWKTDQPLDPEKEIQGRGGFLEGIDEFDAAFFGVSPREAEVLDPQQRLMLETSWLALEDAGVPTASLSGTRTGVYFGGLWQDYERLREDRGARPTQHSISGNALDMLSARISYFLGLTGPSLTLETGCSSSLVALHLACQAIRAGDVDGALVGAANLMLTPDVTIGLTHFGGLSPKGRCSAFGAGADGFVRGEGVAAVYLKTLERARRDGDRVHAVIVRTASNNDGGGTSLVTPSLAGQEDLLRRVYAESGIPVDRVAYVEAHGTGTRAGDPVEATALGRVLGQAPERAGRPLGIGSVKTNIGHLEPVAALAGLFKAVLSLKNGVVPPSLHSAELNPDIPFGELGLEVVREPLPLPADGGPVYLGVSSFGWGGTNAHAVITAAPPATTAADAAAPQDRGRAPFVLPLSAHSQAALVQRARDVREALDVPGADPREIAATLGWQRDQFPFRAGLVATDGDGLRAALDAYAADPEATSSGTVAGRARDRGRTAFVFPGQGSQWAAMGARLYAEDPAFAAVIDRCAAALAPHTDWSLTEVLTGRDGDAWMGRVDIVQPVLWAVSVALAAAWRTAGVEPDVVVGHSQGEIAAATVAGILSLEDAALVVARRSAVLLRTAAGTGRMLAVDLDADAATAALEGFEDCVALAVHNGPSSCVLSGDGDSVLLLKELLEADGTYCRLINVDYASHSPLMLDLTDELHDVLAPVRPGEGSIPLMSTVRAAELAGPEMDGSYWVENLCRPVRFAQALDALLDEGVTHVVEVSAHPVLVPALEQIGALRKEPPAVLGTLHRDRGAPEDLAESFAQGHVAGLTAYGPRPTSRDAGVPAYPWQRESYWVGAAQRGAGRSAAFAFPLAPLPTEAGTWHGTTEIGTGSHPWLADHQVHDAVVVPAAASIELCLGTAAARTGGVPQSLRGLSFLSDMTLADGGLHLGGVWREDAGEGAGLEVLSLPDGADGWTRHMTAHASYRAEQAAPPVFPTDLLRQPAVDGAAFYRSCTARGLRYGPAFQGVGELRVHGDEALGRVTLAEQCRPGARRFVLHPALWDGAFQVSLALCGHEDTVVPVAIERLALLPGRPSDLTELWVHAVRRPDGHFDLALYGPDRQPVARVSGLELRRLRSGERSGPAPERVHRFGFHERPYAGPGPDAEQGPWLVCGPDSARAAAVELAGALGGTAVTLPRPWADGTQAWAEALRAADGGEVVFVAPDRAAGEEEQRAGLEALGALAGACADRPVAPRLTVLTTRAQAASATEAPDPGAALYWGFVRVLQGEHPGLAARLVDTAGDDGWAAGVVRELLDAEREDQVLSRGERRLAGRLERGGHRPDDSAAPLPYTGRQPFRLHPGPRPGLWESLRYLPLVRRRPGPGEIEIEVDAASLNFIDVMKAVGTYPDEAGGKELLGGDCSGRVVSVGPGTDGFRVGDRVVACIFGAIVSHVTVRADHARPVPEEMTQEDAAALPLVLATAWYALHDLARTEPGETVLVHSAAGGLGLAAVQVARMLGAQVIATAGSAAKRAYLRELGVEHVFDSRDLSWADAVLERTGGRGVDVVLNSLTGAAIARGLEVLAEDGRFVEVGKKDIHGERTLGLAPFRKGVSFAAVDLEGLVMRRPQRFARLFRAVWDEVEAGRLTALPVTQYTFDNAAEALRAMSHGDHIGKFVLYGPQSVERVVADPLPYGRFRADGTYLITGGLGDLGLSLAEHLVERGATALALLGRSEPSPQAADRLAALRAAGARVSVVHADVADATSLDLALARVRAELPALRGVFHAAGVLSDAVVRNLDAADVARVLAPKVDGAAELDRLTADDPLDLFVLFSSAAGLVGNVGQSAYAAANTFMDALAVARRAAGRPALSVQWGTFDGIGLAARSTERGERLADRGMDGFEAAEAWRALESFLADGESVVGYVALDPRRWFETYPAAAGLPSWSLLRTTGEPGAGSGGDFRQLLGGCPEEERHAMVEERVRQLAGRVLRLSADSIDRETPLKSLGLDSLMSLELRNRLEADLGLRLSPTLLWTYGALRPLAGALVERLAEQEA
ncbi:phthioceranic/hydroxyphthioceranic acid synthase [Streptomyces virginiae]|uniref:Phthioceranic/hydroxyphthioceranic acid synthase n=1 Tax=Streptomyces virginiae TaxID=1961 RepID=A0ABQ3NW40_STRVG|nr:type I polyketide synthase [Streptomyces virginiae]MBP2344649.1 phthiocerol/phenolphthiocerol synthesis type-I polyketide synthase C [Streptomyces virginiae]GGQ16155.1 phthioceranic/hydroxyphthioceranic acid synthase [Streptomyces virginiae]GHI16992.1 phthioceranic/hydroxyphthioceranic acid synthase [Streptomyces virginiae]